MNAEHIVTVTASSLNGRAGPGRIFPIVTRKVRGDKLSIIYSTAGNEHVWLAASLGPGVAWFAEKYTRETEVTESFYWHAWPTPYLSYPAYPYKIAVNQHFGDRPSVYKRYNLPGHEGIDFFVEMADPITAVAPGEVIRVELDPAKHNYGKHVRIQHAAGYKTVYAHLSAANVQVGDQVAAGKIIGLAGSTGNSTGVHLHLTMKQIGATAKKITEYPYDIIDPTPFMEDYLRG